MCGPWRPLFHASHVVRRGPISNKSVSSQDPLLKRIGNFSIHSLNFCPNFSFQSPLIWKFSAHKPPNLEIFIHKPPNLEVSVHTPFFQRQISVYKPHTSEMRAVHPYLKKVECPLPPAWALLSLCPVFVPPHMISCTPKLFAVRIHQAYSTVHIWSFEYGNQILIHCFFSPFSVET